jgi:hypothetical protein
MCQQLARRKRCQASICPILSAGREEAPEGQPQHHCLSCLSAWENSHKAIVFGHPRKPCFHVFIDSNCLRIAPSNADAQRVPQSRCSWLRLLPVRTTDIFRPRRCASGQPASHLGQSEPYVLRVTHHLHSDLYQLLPQARHRPVLHGRGSARRRRKLPRLYARANNCNARSPAWAVSLRKNSATCAGRTGRREATRASLTGSVG